MSEAVRPLRRIVWWAWWWAVLLSAAEFAVLAPLRGVPLSTLLLWCLTGWALPVWVLAGVGYLLLARSGERRGTVRGLWLYPLALALGVSLVQPLVSLAPELMPAPRAQMSSFGEERMGQLADASGYAALVLYNLWLNLFYGRLLVGAYVLAVRAERERSLWREATIARGRAERALDEARLHTLRSQVDPQLLLDTLRRCERLYHNDAALADDLLDRLVDFLRLALPGLKSPDSTLSAELELAAAWGALHQALSGRAGWRIDRPALLHALPFPSLVMLPLLAWGEGSAAPRLEVVQDGRRLRLRVLGVERRLPQDLLLRTRACLHAVFGSGFALHLAPAALEIELHHTP